MRSKIVFILIVVFGIFFGYNYLFPDHRSIDQEAVRFTMDAEAVFSAFIENAPQAESKYLDQTLVVSGIISAVNSQGLTINNKIDCKINTIDLGLQVNDSIAIKGRCIGYDDLLELGTPPLQPSLASGLETISLFIKSVRQRPSNYAVKSHSRRQLCD